MTNGPVGTSPDSDNPRVTSSEGASDEQGSAEMAAPDAPDADAVHHESDDVAAERPVVAAAATSRGAATSGALPASASEASVGTTTGGASAGVDGDIDASDGSGSDDADEDDADEDGADDDGADDEEGGSHAADGKRPRSFWRELPVLVVVALVLAFLIKSFLVQAFYIPSESMEDTLLIGDRVLVNKLAYRIGDVERGDVIVFDGTDSFDVGTKTSEDSGNIVTRSIKKVASSFGLAPGSDNDYIKRVIGIGGDHVVCCDDKGHITVNGTALAPEDYLFPGDKPSNTPFDITVPPDRVWVMGDHRSRSEDSRAHLGNPGGGTVPVDHIVGRAFVIVWPFNRFDTLTRPADFDKIAAASP